MIDLCLPGQEYKKQQENELDAQALQEVLDGLWAALDESYVGLPRSATRELWRRHFGVAVATGSCTRYRDATTTN